MSLTIKEAFVLVFEKKLRVHSLNQPSGEGKPVLVFLHEGLGCIELWKDFPRLLLEATGLNGIVYERQGYGQSDDLDWPRPANYLEIEAQQYLPQLLKKLNIENPILIGHSDGGTIALLYAAENPVKMVLTAAAHVLVEPITIEGIQTVVSHYSKDKMGKKLEKYHGKKADKLFWAWADTWLRESFRTWNVEDFLPSITCPCLLIQGKEDEYATEEQLQRIQKGIGASSQVLLINECQHVPHIQQKEVTLAAMVHFIRQKMD